MNFITKNLIEELKDLIELKLLINSCDDMINNFITLSEFLQSEIDQHIKDIIHTENL